LARSGDVDCRSFEQSLTAAAQLLLGAAMALMLCEKFCVWGARVLGLTFFLFIGFFVVAHAFSAEGLPNLWAETSHVRLEALALFLMTVGGVVGWKSTGVASAMIFSGYVLWLLMSRHVPWPPGIIEFPLLIGLLYMGAWYCRSGSPAQRSRAVG
jgi:hypothetical protein